MSDYVFLSWSRGEAKVKAFSTMSRAAATIVKIEIEVKDPYALGSLIQQLHEAQHPPKSSPPTSTKAERLRLADQRPLALMDQRPLALTDKRELP